MRNAEILIIPEGIFIGSDDLYQRLLKTWNVKADTDSEMLLKKYMNCSMNSTPDTTERNTPDTLRLSSYIPICTAYCAKKWMYSGYFCGTNRKSIFISPPYFSCRVFPPEGLISAKCGEVTHSNPSGTDSVVQTGTGKFTPSSSSSSSSRIRPYLDRSVLLKSILVLLS
jgi:hypothetical protein